MRSSQVLFYLVKQSMEWDNAGLSSAAGQIIIDGTSVAIADSSSASGIESSINSEFGAGFCSVSLATETFTIVFNDGGFHTMQVYIDGSEVEVTDVTNPTADMVIAEQVNIDISRAVDTVDTPSKEMNGAYRGMAVGHRLEVTNENLYVATDDNYDYLAKAVDERRKIYALVKTATGDISCSAIIESLDEKADLKDVVRATASWVSSGPYVKS